MIRRFSVKGYKTFVHAELPLEPLTVLFGPNASGKSNTFDALNLLKEAVASPSLTDAMKTHRGTAIETCRLPAGGLPELLGQKKASFTLEADLWLSPRAMERVEEMIRASGESTTSRRKVVEKFLRYKLTVELHTAFGSLRVKDEELLAIRSDGLRRPKREPFILSKGGKPTARMEGQDQAVRPLDPGRRTAASASLYAPHHPHVAAFREEVAGWNFYHLDPIRLAGESPLTEVATPGPRGEGLSACLHTLKTSNPRGFGKLNENLRKLVPGAEGVDVERTGTGTLRLVVREEGRTIPARLCSAGTLRVIGLLTVISCDVPDSVIGVEEPENGVHPTCLEHLVDVLRNRTGRGKRQIIMNTHSPILADLFSRDHLVLCRKEEKATTFTPVNALEPLFRRPEIERTMEV